MVSERLFAIVFCLIALAASPTQATELRPHSLTGDSHEASGGRYYLTSTESNVQDSDKDFKNLETFFKDSRIDMPSVMSHQQIEKLFENGKRPFLPESFVQRNILCYGKGGAPFVGVVYAMRDTEGKQKLGVYYSGPYNYGINVAQPGGVPNESPGDFNRRVWESIERLDSNPGAIVGSLVSEKESRGLHLHKENDRSKAEQFYRVGTYYNHLIVKDIGTTKKGDRLLAARVHYYDFKNSKLELYSDVYCVFDLKNALPPPPRATGKHADLINLLAKHAEKGGSLEGQLDLISQQATDLLELPKGDKAYLQLSENKYVTKLAGGYVVDFTTKSGQEWRLAIPKNALNSYTAIDKNGKANYYNELKIGLKGVIGKRSPEQFVKEGKEKNGWNPKNFSMGVLEQQLKSYLNENINELEIEVKGNNRDLYLRWTNGLGKGELVIPYPHWATPRPTDSYLHFFRRRALVARLSELKELLI